MNILPFLFAFLLVFQFLFTVLQRDLRSAAEEWNFVRSSHFLDRKLLAKEKFRKLPKKKIKNPRSSTEKKKFHPRALREITAGSSSSKLDISSLFLFPNNEMASQLQKLLRKILMALYGDALFIHQGDKKIVCELLIEEFKSIEMPSSLCSLYPRDSSLQAIFYRMLKGTHSYQLDSSGIAPLEDFFVLSSYPKAKPISFPSASPYLLQILFDKNIADKIVAKERAKSSEAKKPSFLTQSELEDLLAKNHMPQEKINASISLMSFQLPKREPASIVAQDPHTHMQRKYK